ncbi:MAG: UDP-N-acetylmuramate:L-alanyl-gamma-D-glutamyl-meso-diaminopimelate ligase [Alteromonadaceae bacterium]|nr:MAG: UDP-N-acetylmuramate:L-alanyl-gamma-D-glutamyl-meso-diaminopimelate ligase [Alteromonadaceae bacterium]
MSENSPSTVGGHIHILGICGTFMGSIAQLAKAAGFRVTGADTNVYPPMSTQLEAAGIELIEGFGVEQLALKPDLFVVGNVVSRGNPLMEAILDKSLPYTSGPQWLAEHILQDKWVLAVAGTHGKTTTSSMLAWILEYAGMAPGYLIGGVPGNFGVSARLGGSDFFVIEADEYDTAFFDKRSKFVHYRPSTLVLNNLEFDHADIFDDLNAIQTQFHHLLRTVPQIGQVIYQAVPALSEVLDRGCWSGRQTLASNLESASSDQYDWKFKAESASAERFGVFFQGEASGEITWQLSGVHNMQNAVAAVAAARHVGVLPELACEALSQFSGVKRRMELVGDVNGVRVYDDFAHHPTAIALTLQGLRAKVGSEPIVAVLEPRSHTMKRGVHKDGLLNSVGEADEAIWFQPEGLQWDLAAHVNVDDVDNAERNLRRSDVIASIDGILERIVAIATANNGKKLHIVVMSNGGFAGIHGRILSVLKDCIEGLY